MVTKEDIAAFILEREKVSWSDLENFFAISPRSKKENKYVCPECKSSRVSEDLEAAELVCGDCGFVLRSMDKDDCRIARQTLLNHVNALVKEGTVEKILNEITVRPVYQISKKAKVEIENIKAKKDLKTLLDLMPSEEITKLHDIFMASSIFELPLLKNNQVSITLPAKDVDTLKEIILNINTRRRLQKLKNVGAPQKIIEIGLRMLINGNKLSKVELFKFYYYPITEFDAQVWRNYAEYSKKSGKSDSFEELIETLNQEDPEYIKSVMAAQEKLLKHSTREFVEEYKEKKVS